MLVLLMVTSALVAACGGGPTVDFVGNSSCPIEGAQPYSPSPPDTNGDPVGQAIDEMPHTHLSPPAKVTYKHDPPTSGCHYSLGPPNPAPVAAGDYNHALAPEYWVHNLEHGYVAVLYNCPSGCDSDFQQLRAWRKKLSPDPQGQSCQPPIGYAKVIVLPWTSMQPKFAAVSWDYYDPMPKLDIAEIQRFYDNHNGHAPESVCTP